MIKRDVNDLFCRQLCVFIRALGWDIELIFFRFCVMHIYIHAIYSLLLIIL